MNKNAMLAYDDLPELTDEQLAQFKPIEQVMPPEFMQMVLAHQAEREAERRRGKQKAPTKQAITIRLSPEIITAFKATGKGWQTRINEVLLQHIQTAM
ncbi:toxin-antitoxin system, antitoxin component [Haemophilus paracuniculus]|uniref:Toxin-antitoxin system, antitoxin component n=1 Tax=Haemophilus paracuniculus TaxID=734 RepID=A0A1T0ASD7_9PAST|nr:BrnA antitoxin family protein [Haemophilus paracuniculus]OOR98778.1 toxin-antitoxin system, antitoxin component [Haemophilus paracuniculus]